MTRDSQAAPYDDEDHDASGHDDSTHFSWEFAAEDRAQHESRHESRRTPPTDDQQRRYARPDRDRAAAAKPRSTNREIDAETSRSRAGAVRRMLDAALDQWWMEGLLPMPRQLRDGLEVLVAGVDLPEPQRTLLLRAAFFHDRGIATALRYQTDPERVGLVMTEMLLEGLDPQQLAPYLTQAEREPAPWRSTLARELRLVLASGDTDQRRRAQLAYETLFGEELGERIASVPIGPNAPRTHAPWIRRLLLVALALAFVGFFVWQRVRWLPPAEMVSIPQGTYQILGSNGAWMAPIASDGFLMDRFEVTNAEYRRCIERGACGWPMSNDSVTRDDYLVIPAFADYPVVNVTVVDATAYCTWRKKRLPTEVEWQIAAAGPHTVPPTAYPWGVTFDSQRANTLPAGFEDTLVVGFFRPAGDSLFGVADLAGNVAEWTSTSAENALDAKIVKGGSFQSEAAQATVFAQEVVAADETYPWLGFRCARGATTGQ